MRALFSRFAIAVARLAGHPAAFVSAVILVAVWAATGPAFAYSDSWQLVIGTITTIATFILVFIIQNTQNRDTKAMQAKLDELISCTSGARDSLIHVEDTDEKVIDAKRKDPARPPGDDYGNDS